MVIAALWCRAYALLHQRRLRRDDVPGRRCWVELGQRRSQRREAGSAWKALSVELLLHLSGLADLWEDPP
jgi:hypothetical protein